MSDQTAEQSSQPAETTQQPSTPSLEEISKEFSVEEQAKQFQATPNVQQPPVQQYQPQQPYIPDPITDPDGYKQWVYRQTQAVTGVQSSFQTLEKRLAAFEQAQLQQKIDADVNRVVTRLNEKLSSDPELVEAMLEVQYRKDPTFKFIWDNRDRNPQAFEKAIDAIAGRLGPKFQMKQDPQLTENQRAIQTSQRTLATTQNSSEMEAIAKMSPGEFDVWWQQKKAGA